MRVTNNMLISNMMTNINRNLVRMDKYQNQLASGKKIQMPSDDPVVAARALKLRTDVASIEQYKKNVSDAQSWLDVTESTLANMGSVLQRARTLANQASNGTNTNGEFEKIAIEINQLKGQLIQQSNTTYAGRYIFSGYKTDQKLMIDDENDPNYGTYNISVDTVGEKILFETGVSDRININVTAGDLFNGGINAPDPTSGQATALVPRGTFPLSITAGTNDTLNIAIDGKDVSLTLAANTYDNMSQLAAEVNTALAAAGYPDVKASEVTGAQTPGTTTASIKSDGIPLTITTGVNDTLDLTIDGSLISTTIEPGNYNNLSELAAKIQQNVNDQIETSGAPIKPIKVEAINGELKFTTSSLGSQSSIGIESSSLSVDLKMNTISQSAGLCGPLKIISSTTGPNSTIEFKSSNFKTSTGMEVISAEAGLGGGINAVGATGGNTVASVATGVVPITITAGVNDTINLTVDGTMVNATIKPGTYSNLDDLAAQMQADINTHISVAGLSAKPVVIEASGGTLSFSTTSKGKTSEIIIGTSPLESALGLATVSSTKGTVGDKSPLIQDFDDFINALKQGNVEGVQNFLSKVDVHIDNVLRVRADVGARENRLELTANRQDSDYINFTNLKSKNEDVDMAETIMNLKNEENVYNASLAGGARIIQPTLMDFLK